MMDYSIVQGRVQKILSPVNGKSAAIGVLSILLMSLMPFGTGFAQSISDGPRIIPVPTTRPSGEADGLPSFIPAPTTPVIFPKENAILQVSAVMGKDQKPIRSGVIWRVFSDKQTAEGKLTLLNTSSSSDPVFDLPAGYYYVHASFGYAEQAKRIKLMPPFTEASFKIMAGGLRLNAAFREGDFIPAKDLRFEIARRENDTLKTLVADALADELIRLPVGQYHVTSRYGDINSEVSANVRIKSGELTEVTLYQRGAEITLKLVSERGGEALANTSWTILTPGGDPVVNTVKSAFPSFVLAAGDYVAFVRHENKNYSTSFKVESGIHRDVEVVLEQ